MKHRLYGASPLEFLCLAARTSSKAFGGYGGDLSSSLHGVAWVHHLIREETCNGSHKQSTFNDNSSWFLGQCLGHTMGSASHGVPTGSQPYFWHKERPKKHIVSDQRSSSKIDVEWVLRGLGTANPPTDSVSSPRKEGSLFKPLDDS